MQGGIDTLIITNSAMADGFLDVSMLPYLFGGFLYPSQYVPSGLDSTF